jgi:TonB family protein
VTVVTAVTFADINDLLKSSAIARYRERQLLISGIAMRMRYVLVLFLLFSYGFRPSGTAQGQQAPATGNRRVVQKINPVYPEIAKKMNLSGTVKVVAVVSADGTVKSVEPVGGSPVLLKAAQDAVVKWRFAPGGESRELIELRFDPQ